MIAVSVRIAPAVCRRSAHAQIAAAVARALRDIGEDPRKYVLPVPGDASMSLAMSGERVRVDVARRAG